MWTQFVERMQKKKFAYYVTLVKVGVSEEEFIHAFKSHLEMESLPSDISYDTLSGYLFNETLRRLLVGRKNEEEGDDSESDIFTVSSGSRRNSGDDGENGDDGNNDNGDDNNGSDDGNNNSDTIDSDDAFNPNLFNGDPRNMSQEQLDALLRQLQTVMLERAIRESLLEQRQQEQRQQEQQQQNGNDVVIEEVNDEESDSAPSVNSVDWVVCHKHTIHTGSLQSCCAPPRRRRKTGRARASP